MFIDFSSVFVVTHLPIHALTQTDVASEKKNIYYPGLPATIKIMVHPISMIKTLRSAMVVTLIIYYKFSSNPMAYSLLGPQNQLVAPLRPRAGPGLIQFGCTFCSAADDAFQIARRKNQTSRFAAIREGSMRSRKVRQAGHLKVRRS